MRRWMTVLVSAVLVTACGGTRVDQNPPGSARVTEPDLAETRTAEAILAELEEQRALWAEKGDNAYTMVVEIGCFCPEEYRGPFAVTVVDGDIESVTMNDEQVEPADRSFLTVEGLFSTIEDNAHSDEITVTYAPAGYPSAIDIDPDFNIVDEELFIEVHELVPDGG